MNLWKTQFEDGDVTHFPALASLLSGSHEDDVNLCRKYVQSLADLEGEFKSWFHELDPLQDIFKVFATPFLPHARQAPPNLQMELIATCNLILK